MAFCYAVVTVKKDVSVACLFFSLWFGMVVVLAALVNGALRGGYPVKMPQSDRVFLGMLLCSGGVIFGCLSEVGSFGIELYLCYMGAPGDC